MKSVIINGYPYRVYESEKMLRKQMKRVREKIKAKAGFYKDYPDRYRDYPELLVYLEGIYAENYC